MRIPSGKTDQSVFFVALDSTDRVTRKTGLSAFTVYRSRNAGTATVYTTPTIVELSTSNMPGVYALLIDEDTTIASGSDSEEYCVHITCSTMAPVSRTIELYRRDTTSGRTLDVSSGGEAGLDWANVGSPTTALALTGTTIATTQAVASVSGNIGGNVTGSVGSVTGLDASKLDVAVSSRSSHAAADVWSVTTRLLTAGTNIVLAKGTGVTGFNDIAAGAAMTLTAAYDAAKTAATQTSVDDLPTNAELATALAGADDAVLAQVALVKAKTDNLPSDPADASDIAGAFSAVNATLSTIASYIDTEVAAIKTQTDKLVFTVPNILDVNIQYVNDVQINGVGTAGNPWGP